MTWWQQLSAALTAPNMALTGMVCAFLAWFVRNAIRTSNAEQLAKLENEYVPARTSLITGLEIERMLAALRADLDRYRAEHLELHTYSHATRHDLDGMLAVAKVQRELAQALAQLAEKEKG